MLYSYQKVVNAWPTTITAQDYEDIGRHLYLQDLSAAKQPCVSFT